MTGRFYPADQTLTHSTSWWTTADRSGFTQRCEQEWASRMRWELDRLERAKGRGKRTQEEAA